MRRMMLTIAAVAALGASGCATLPTQDGHTYETAPSPCENCAHPLHQRPTYVGHLPHGYMNDNAGPMGPQSPTYAYPYYTTRAPRDFLMANPPTIGN